MLSVNSKKLENNTLLRHRMVVLILYLPLLTSYLHLSCILWTILSTTGCQAIWYSCGCRFVRVPEALIQQSTQIP